jgi:RluA family pseudouridine synthase
VTEVVKLSSPQTHQFWEIPVLYEDQQLLALNKPSGLLVSPDRYDPARPNLMKLLHRDIERAAPWAKARGLNYLMNAHRLDFETTGVILLVKNKTALVSLANQFGSEKARKTYLALVRGSAPEDQFETQAKLAPHPLQTGRMRVVVKAGKHSRTQFRVRERFQGYLLLECRPLTGRTHQIRVHLRHLRLPIVGDALYGGPCLLLSTLKPDYRQKPSQPERPLMDRVALHAQELAITHPATAAETTITAPWPKDLTVAVKYLRRFAGAQ